MKITGQCLILVNILLTTQWPNFVNICVLISCKSMKQLTTQCPNFVNILFYKLQIYETIDSLYCPEFVNILFCLIALCCFSIDHALFYVTIYFLMRMKMKMKIRLSSRLNLLYLLQINKGNNITYCTNILAITTCLLWFDTFNHLWFDLYAI